jgi:DNA-binding XRE family transcriptional regulator
MKHPGEVIKMWRLEQNMTQETLASKSNVDKGTIVRFEKCGNFHWKVFESACESLGKTLKDAYAVLAGISDAMSYQSAGALCSDPTHAEYQKKLDEIFHKEGPQGAWIQGNVITFHERLFGPSPGGSKTERRNVIPAGPDDFLPASALRKPKKKVV